MTVHTIFGPWTSEDLAVLEVARGEWRVSDLLRRRPEGPEFVGLVRSCGEDFLASNLPLEYPAQRFTNLDSAVAYLEEQYLATDYDLEDTVPWPPPHQDR